MLQKCCAAILRTYVSFSLREKVTAERSDEGLARSEQREMAETRTSPDPHSGATLSFKEREGVP